MSSGEIDSEKLAEDRKNYYDKWHKLASEEVEKAKIEEKQEEEKASEDLGLNKGPKSKAEEEDIKKREALKEAKKQWEQKELSEAAKKHSIENLENVDRVLDSVKLHWKPVIVLKNNKNCKLKIPHNLKHKLVKVFIENCKNCEIDFECSSVTQHLEITRSEKCLFRIKAPTATVQLDLCKGCEVEYSELLMEGDKTRLFHAGVEDLKVTSKVHGGDHTFTFKDHVDESDVRPEEVQFLTYLKENKIVTERVVRDKGNLPTTKDDLVEQKLSAKTAFREAELKRIGGNEAFQEKHYAQAAVFYTESLDILDTVRQQEDFESEDDFTHLLLSNRAFCWQKLGHHDRAEEDCRKCIALKPDFCKAQFRLGLALHAQKKYFEAVPVLGKAFQLEPKNQQIKQALGFAEIQMRKIMQNDG